jgi:hypothetical protein
LDRSAGPAAVDRVMRTGRVATLGKLVAALIRMRLGGSA